MPNLNPQALENLIAITSKKMGVSPESLRADLKNGTFDKALSKLSPQDSQKLQKALSDPKLAQVILSSPQAKEIFKKITSENK